MPQTLPWGRQTDKKTPWMSHGEKFCAEKQSEAKKASCYFKQGGHIAVPLSWLFPCCNQSSRNLAQPIESPKDTLNEEMATEGHSYQTIHPLEKSVKPHGAS